MNFLVFSLLFATASSLRISKSDNDVLQSRCGLPVPRQERKVINGDEVTPWKQPWTATLLIKGGSKLLYGPLTVISNHHLIGFNVVRVKNGQVTVMGYPVEERPTCEGVHMVLPTSYLSQLDVAFGDVSHAEASNFTSSIAKVVVVGGCEKSSSSKPMIVELKKEVNYTSNDVIPICVSNTQDNWNKVVNFTLSGLNRSKIYSSLEMEPVECDKAAPIVCAKAVNINQGLCSGDFGGAATGLFNYQQTLVAIYTRGNVACRAEPATIKPYQFLNLGYFRDDICEITGVCVPAPASGTSGTAETTTSGPIVAETFDTLNITETVGLDGENVVAETFEPMQIDENANSSCSNGSDNVNSNGKEVHIHIHFD